MSLVNAETGEVVAILSEADALNLAAGISRQLDRVNNENGALVELIADALKGKAWVALGYGSWDQMIDAMGWEFSPRTSTDRAALAKVFRESGMSLRAIGKVIGAPKSTVADDLRQVSETGQVVTGIDGKTYPAQVEYETPHGEGVDGDGESNAGDASNGDGVDSHDVEQLEPESTPELDTDPVGLSSDRGEVEAATDGDEVEGISTHPSGATSPSSFLTVPGVASAVRQALKLTKLDSAEIRALNNQDLDFTIDSWVVSAEQFAADWRASKPSHLRIVEGPE